MNLSGNTIFVTGGGSGIGRGLAEALPERGNKVIIAGRRRGHRDTVIAANPGMEGVELDITSPASIERVAAKLLAEHPDLNVLINNAGIMQPDAAAGQIDDALLVATMKAGLIDNIPLGRLGTADDLGKAAVFLASDDSAYITGVELDVDGGVSQY